MIFMLGISFTKDIKNDLMLLNDCAKKKKNRLQSLKQLSDFIEFHSITKQFSSVTIITQSSKISSLIVFSSFCLLFFCGFQIIARFIGICTTNIFGVSNIQPCNDMWCNVIDSN